MADAPQQSTTVLVVGAGAIGAFYGGLLARAGAEVAVVCRSGFDTVRSRGFDIRSPMGDFVFRPVQVLRSAAECATPPDVLLLAVKAVRGLDRVALVRAAVGPRTVIVLFGNGIGIERELAEAFPDNELVSVLAVVGISRGPDATVHHHALGALTMGNFPRGVSPRTEQFAALLRSVGLTCQTTADVVAARWLKNLWNIAFNPVSVLGGTLDTRSILAPPEGIAFVRRVMQEAAAVAAAEGHPIDPATIESTLASTRAMAPYKTSMAQDHAAGRPMEVEPIVGNVLRLARSHGLAVPSIEALYALLRMVQSRDEGIPDEDKTQDAA